jgi:hypothetical protein
MDRHAGSCDAPGPHSGTRFPHEADQQSSAEAPVLAAYAVKRGTNVIGWVAWCDHCRRWHNHDAREGYREPACVCEAYSGTGYGLRYAGLFTEEIRNSKGPEAPLPRLTPAQTIRAMCRKCLCLRKGEPGYDCLGATCPLYPAMPFRGRSPSRKTQPDGPPAHEVERMAELAKTHPRRTAVKAMLRDQCRTCIPDKDQNEPESTHLDCTDEACPLFPWRPMQPGGMPKSPSRVSMARRQGNLPQMREGLSG